MQHYKCYIIRLEENKHSCQVAEDCYQQTIKFGINADFFNAVNGNEADKHYGSLNIKKAGKFKKDHPGVVGCFLSHYYLWKQCVKEDIPFIILEHDGYFIKKLPENIFDTFTEVLKLDRLNPYELSYSNQLDSEIDLDIIVESYINPNPKQKTRLGIDTNYFKGAYSYIIKPAAAKKLIDYISEHGHVPADQQLSSTIVDLKTTIPTLARLHPFYSIGNNIKSASLTRNLR
jgi:glycosyl transferase family 25